MRIPGPRSCLARLAAAGLLAVWVGVPTGARATDSCATAQPLLLDAPVSGDTRPGFVDDYQLVAGSPCFPAGHNALQAIGRDAVYSFVAPATASYSFAARSPVSA